MDINLHRVKSVTLTDIKETLIGSFVRDIVITCDNGQEVTLTLFARGDEDYLVPREQSMEDWK
jgi:hypothetical protein